MINFRNDLSLISVKPKAAPPPQACNRLLSIDGNFSCEAMQRKPILAGINLLTAHRGEMVFCIRLAGKQT